MAISYFHFTKILCIIKPHNSIEKDNWYMFLLKTISKRIKSDFSFSMAAILCFRFYSNVLKYNGMKYIGLDINTQNKGIK